MARISWQEACQLDPSLNSLKSLLPALPDFAETLMGGLTNRCWRLTLSALRRYVWRPDSSLIRAFAISRHQEYQVLHFLAEKHYPFAPRPVAHNAQGLLIEWIDGETQPPVDVLSLSRVLAQIHQLDTASLPLVPFNFTARVDHYWRMLSMAGFDTHPFNEQYQRWRTPPDVIGHVNTLCHFDIGPHNLVLSERGLMVIDWEYAAYASPLIDLAITGYATGLDMFQLVGCYCQLRGISELDGWVEGVKAWLPRVMMMSMLWYLVAYAKGYGDHYFKQAINIQDELCKRGH